MQAHQLLDPIFTALAAQERRRVCQYVRERESVVTTDELARHLCGDAALPSAEPDDRQRRMVVSLHHSHLPILDNAGIVAYNASADRVESDENLQLAKSILEAVVGTEYDVR